MVDDLSAPQLFDLTSIANLMDFPPLLSLSVLKITFLLSGRNADEIREVLQLPEPTEEEMRAARQDPNNRWLFADDGEEE
jgi:hypothetical protein